MIVLARKPAAGLALVLVLAAGEATAQLAPTTAENSSCPFNRFVGVGIDGYCPPAKPSPNGAGEWQRSYLFASDPERLRALPRAMRSYCTYEWLPTAGSSRAPTVDDLASLPDLTEPNDPDRPMRQWWQWLGADCQVVNTLADPEKPLAGVLNAQYKTQLDPLRSFPAARRAHQRARTRMVFVDSTPFQEEVIAHPGRLGHGFAVIHLAQGIACPPGDERCRVYPVATLGTPLRYSEESGQIIRDERRGGFVGTPGTVARGIADGIFSWTGPNNAALPPVDQPRAIINLSVGWDPSYNTAGFGRPRGVRGKPRQQDLADCDGKELSPPACAVRIAIKHAVCKGALVLAAAGNHPGGMLASRGPLLPAALEKEPAPTYEECVRFEDDNSGNRYRAYVEGMRQRGIRIFPEEQRPRSATLNKPAGGQCGGGGCGLYWPLVYAVSGVDGADQPQANRRPGARSRLAAPASFGGGVISIDPSAPEEWDRIDGTESLSGSSMSTGAVTGVAAVLWSYDPWMPAPTLMQLLYDSAVDLHQPWRGAEAKAEFCLDGPSCDHWPVKRVSMCAAMHKLCDRLGGCTELQCEVRPPYSDRRVTVDAATAETVQRFFKVEFVATLTPTVVEDPLTRSSSSPDDLGTSVIMAPWALTQPGVGPCPHCAAALSPDSDTASLFLSIDPTYQSQVSLTGLELNTSTGRSVFAMTDTDLLDLTPGAKIFAEIGSVDLDPSETITSAALSFSEYSDFSGVSTTIRQEILLVEP